MKTKIILLALITTIGLKAQSIVTLGTGTSLEIQTGADFCADSINGSGTISGTGTLYGEPATEVEQAPTALIPTQFDMSQNYPNPFNPTTKITFQLPKASRVSIRLYDVLGREVNRLFESERPAGYYTATMDGANLAAGVYFYRIEAHAVSGETGVFIKTLKMALIK